jgi:hypothetical protein
MGNQQRKGLNNKNTRIEDILFPLYAISLFFLKGCSILSSQIFPIIAALFLVVKITLAVLRCPS